MKTAVSLPDTLFRKADKAARKLRISRSQLYAAAIAEYLERRESEAITRKLNEVYSRQNSSLDPALERAQFESIGIERW